MTWDALSAEVAVMFGELTWRTDEYQLTLESWATKQLFARRAARHANAKARAASNDRWRARNPETYRQMKNHNRWRNRKRKAARRAAKLKAAAAAGGRARGLNILLRAKAELKRRIEMKRAA